MKTAESRRSLFPAALEEALRWVGRVLLLCVLIMGIRVSPDLLQIDLERESQSERFKKEAAMTLGWFWTPEIVKALAFGHLPTAVDSLLISFSVSEPNAVRGFERGRSAGFYELEAASTLDPGYLEIYSQGANYLAVIRHDPVGAKTILMRGMDFQQNTLPKLPQQSAELQWPQRWHLPMVLAYVELFELQDLKSASEHFLVAARTGEGPLYLKSLGARLSRRSSTAELGLRLLDNQLRQSGLTLEVKEQLNYRYAMIERLIIRLSVEESLAPLIAAHKRVRLSDFKVVDGAWRKELPVQSIVNEMQINSSGKVIDPKWNESGDPWLSSFEAQIRTFKLGDSP